MGFGWSTVATLVATAAGAVLLSALAKWVALAGAVLAGAFAFTKYQTYNAKGWPQVHNRAMLRLASLAGAEVKCALSEGRPVDPTAASRELILETLEPQEDAKVVLGNLEQHQGAYLASLVEKHGADVLPGREQDTAMQLLVGLRQVEFGPNCAVCKIVERNFGSLEAAKYVMAMIQGRAR